MPPSFTTTSSAHIELDDPFTLRLLENPCGDDRDKLMETEAAAEEVICARIRF